MAAEQVQIKKGERKVSHAARAAREAAEQVRDTSEAADRNHAYEAAGRVACSKNVNRTADVLDDIDAIVAESEGEPEREVTPMVAIGIGELALVA